MRSGPLPLPAATPSPRPSRAAGTVATLVSAVVVPLGGGLLFAYLLYEVAYFNFVAAAGLGVLTGLFSLLVCIRPNDTAARPFSTTDVPPDAVTWAWCRRWAVGVAAYTSLPPAAFLVALAVGEPFGLGPAVFAACGAWAAGAAVAGNYIPALLPPPAPAPPQVVVVYQDRPVPAPPPSIVRGRSAGGFHEKLEQEHAKDLERRRRHRDAD